MNKKQLIARVQRYMGPGATGRTASAAVEAVLSSILSESVHDKLHIARLGTFETERRRARTAVHPITGQPLPVAEHTRLTFRPSVELERSLAFKSNQHQN